MLLGTGEASHHGGELCGRVCCPHGRQEAVKKGLGTKCDLKGTPLVISVLQGDSTTSQNSATTWEQVFNT
jgi:hypothetical protein